MRPLAEHFARLSLQVANRPAENIADKERVHGAEQRVIDAARRIAGMSYASRNRQLLAALALLEETKLHVNTLRRVALEREGSPPTEVEGDPRGARNCV